MTRRKKSIRSLQRRLNQSTFLLVIGLGLIAMMTIISDPSGLRIKPIPDREPASVELDQFQPGESQKSTSVLTLECSRRTEMISLTQQVRLRGHLCRDDDKLSILSTKIENKRNGYVATVFHQDRDFTTDFIQLSEGENQVSVEHTLSDGQTELLSYTFTRR